MPFGWNAKSCVLGSPQRRSLNRSTAIARPGWNCKPVTKTTFVGAILSTMTSHVSERSP